MNQSKVQAAHARKRTVANQAMPKLSATACGAQSDSGLLESCSQRRSYNLLISKPFSGVKDRNVTLPSTLCTSHSMTQRSHGQSGQSIWSTANGALLTWMRIGTPLWNTGLCPSLLVFPKDRNLHRVGLSSVQTQIARTARTSRKAERISFTERSSK
jgi:hypothetical protein